MAGKSSGERLAAGPVICAEGYLFELERRGYLQAGAFVPEVVLEHPEVVEQLHRDFVPRRLRRRRGASPITRIARSCASSAARAISSRSTARRSQIAKKVADETGALFAGDICNTNVYDPADAATRKRGARDVRGAGRLGGRRRRRFHHRRDVLVWRRGADRARGDQGGQADRRHHAGDASQAE